MKRRKFIGVLLALPMFGSFVARAFGDEVPPPDHLGTVDEDDVAHTVWGYLDHASSWDETVAPVFHRVCEQCHRPGGGTGAVLSSEEAWEQKRAKLRQRVLVERTMPPAGHPLTDAEREALRAWIER